MIELDDLYELCLGMSFLGTGGGGNPYIGRLMLAEELKAGRRPRLIELERVPDSWSVAFCVTIGSPSVLIEKFPNVPSMLAALRRMEERLAGKLDALVLGEAGGINGTLPLIIGARCGLPVINADGMGRAFPELPMVTFNFIGCSATPLVLADESCQTAVIDAASNAAAERLARSMVTAMGSSASLVAYPMSGRQVKGAAIPGAISFALQIGRLLHQAQAHQASPVAWFVDRISTLCPHRHVRLLYEGKIGDLSRRTTDSFAVGRLTVDPVGTRRDSMTIDFQNEFVLARLEDRVLACVPDLIVVLDRETAQPITTEDLKYGQRVAVVAMAAAPELRTPAALRFVGPRAFRIDMDYVPLEQMPLVSR